MAFLSALIFDGAAASSAQAVPAPIASYTSIAATTDDFIIMFLPHFLFPNGLETHHRIGNRKEQVARVEPTGPARSGRSDDRLRETRGRPGG